MQPTNLALFPVVMCPACDKAMRPAVTRSDPSDLHTTTYRCEACDAQTEHIHSGRVLGADERR